MSQYYELSSAYRNYVLYSVNNITKYNNNNNIKCVHRKYMYK